MDNKELKSLEIINEQVKSELMGKKIQKRDTQIVKTSIIGILANIFLAGFKAVIGILTNSIAIVLDAVNNISDAASSIITITGTKLAGKAPNKKHPFGYGRVEYLSAMIIAFIVLYAGITSFIESIKKIIWPEVPDYNNIALIIILVAVIVKIFLGIYVKKIGKSVNSDSLVNSGKDALLDAIISASTLLAAIIFINTNISLEAWLGAVISIVIIKSGIDMLAETISRILGERIDLELTKKIKKTIGSFENVKGVYDLILNNYGPETFIGSVHIEIPDTYTANEIDELLRKITNKVFDEHNIILSAIGVYSVNTKDEETMKIRNDIYNRALSYNHVNQVHGFYLSKKEKIIRFDLVISFDAGDREEVYEKVKKEIEENYPAYLVQIALDSDYSEH